MRQDEIAFAAVCGILAAGALWCAAGIDEPFYVCAAEFLAAFWGSLAALCVWSRICERVERRNRWRPSIIWPRRRT